MGVVVEGEWLVGGIGGGPLAPFAHLQPMHRFCHFENAGNPDEPHHLMGKERGRGQFDCRSQNAL
jgi:hypothetical protein